MHTQPFDHARLIGPGWGIAESDVQLPAAKPDIDMASVRFKNVVLDDEIGVFGEERIRRIRKAGDPCLTADHFMWLWNHKDKIPEYWKLTKDGKTRNIFFDGTILLDQMQWRYVIYMYWRNGHWRRHPFCLRGGMSKQGQTAVANN